VSQPLDRTCALPELGNLDRESGEFWVGNPFMISQVGENLSAYERNRLFLNVGGDGFLDASFTSSVDLDSDSRSVVHADFDRDGREDLLVGSVGGGPLRLFLNRFEVNGKGFRLLLHDGTGGNVSGIGSRIIVHTDKRKLFRKHFMRNQFQGQNPAETFVGLRSDESLAKIEVRWPDGSVQFFGPQKVGDSKVVTLEKQ